MHSEMTGAERVEVFRKHLIEDFNYAGYANPDNWFHSDGVDFTDSAIDALLLCFPSLVSDADCCCSIDWDDRCPVHGHEDDDDQGES